MLFNIRLQRQAFQNSGCWEQNELAHMGHASMYVEYSLFVYILLYVDLNMMLSDMYCYIVWWIVIPYRIQFDLQLFVYSHAPNIL